ncbi:isoleucine--tRNA ligase, mitochondrial-like isoform X2 [Homarus americanus]|uniref:isoleucine--tRNA ligase, mitochondrial-like isoform X2 n=1 Tax=Homarus americanus TaxID=6706 RepID=UPI001C48C423|nr:isoleucine--tRNA ligase, mitochondrial-like isoform X2 [Homarus americanus]
MRQLRNSVAGDTLLHTRNINWLLFHVQQRFAFTSSVCGKEGQSSESPARNKYGSTVLLPFTTLPLRVEGVKRVHNEKHIQEAANFSSLYEWQRRQKRAQEFVLHDGPPYANGRPHIGHAVNKILKDITVRHKLLRGYKVNYIPGWDCHGLPIELKALQQRRKGKRSKEKLDKNDPIQIRATAKKFAEEAINIQRSAFERWGVLANWNNVYCTFNPEYISRQLQLFAQLYENGYIYQDYKPVYFSPSSGTSLAEAELEYNAQHCSPSVYVALPASNVPHSIQDKLIEYGKPKVHVVVWTTTPWTLPANEAICYSPEKLYTLVLVKRKEQLVACIWAEELLHELRKTVSEDITPLCSFKGSLLSDMKYRHPLNDRLCPCVPGSHVTMNKGTGLVHTAPAHGHDDFLVALEQKLTVECNIDDKGRYQAKLGPELEGKRVLDEGNEAVIQLLSEPSGCGGPSILLSKEDFIHSYPYDWRTKKPVIIRASKQWFMNTEQLKKKALAALKQVAILPSNIQTGMTGQLERRPYWCISRQRVWGVPIPVFYDAVTGLPVVERGIIEHVAEVLLREGCDSWWELPEEKLLPSEYVREMKQQGRQLPTKGMDILDIWFDSGSSWHSVLGGPSADLYLEGVDQFNGWFQSSLLTSVAATGKAPYKKLYVHGFTLDEAGNKMSKSLGNVVDPEIVTDGGKNLQKDPVYGSDVLRWWVASHSTNHANMTIGKRILDQSKESVQKVRAVLRFLLASLGDYNPCEHSLPVADLRPVDQYMLHLIHEHTEKIWEYYEKFLYHRVTAASIAFINSNISGLYISIIKDRLYCESRTGNKRMSALLVLHHLLHHLLLSLAPVLPHLTEEVALHHHSNKDWCVFQQTTSGAPSLWNQPELARNIEQCLTVRDELYRSISAIDPLKLHVKLTAGGNMLQSLRLMQTSTDTTDSGLTELLRVSRVILLPSEGDTEEFSLEVLDSIGNKCLRCWKFTAEHREDLCARCKEVITSTC